MICPFCHKFIHKSDRSVKDSHVQGTGIYRRRQCPHCNKRFSTQEEIERTGPYVPKFKKPRPLDEETLHRIG